ncbi:YolD-like family protein [Ferviditalea candida]|uniref:YolD-like family protein n=1 Tax=Ferviditalea candida TaxID=3108399 RepID=A0ABU5ZFE0_9BACL|nr:YolD-like family protein [Paenibacillaceae bacterium T2]
MSEPKGLKRGNLLWEGSRMMLPEHREQLLEYRRKQKEFQVPELDEDQISKINRMLAEAVREKRPVTAVCIGLYGPEAFSGYVKRVNPAKKRLEIQQQDSETAVLDLAKLLKIEYADGAE